MTERLNGRLEVVKIKESLTATVNCNYGELLRDGKIVSVRDATKYEGRPCLVRFDLRDGPHHKNPYAYFISSIVPPLFGGLAPEQYVLVGLWKKGPSSLEVPSLQEIEEIYRPRNMSLFRYFRKEFSVRQGIYTVGVKKTRPDIKISIGSYLRTFDSQRAACVFIVEDEIDLEKIVAAVKSQGKHPMLMEPLKQLR